MPAWFTCTLQNDRIKRKFMFQLCYWTKLTQLILWYLVNNLLWILKWLQSTWTLERLIIVLQILTSDHIRENTKRSCQPKYSEGYSLDWEAREIHELQTWNFSNKIKLVTFTLPRLKLVCWIPAFLVTAFLGNGCKEFAIIVS